MRPLWCTLILGWRNLGVAFPERDASPLAHTQSGLAKPRLRIPRTRGEPYDARSIGVGETEVLHSQSERRTLCCTLILGWRNLGFAFPERDASLMAHAHSRLAQLAVRIPRTRSKPYGAHTIWVIASLTFLAFPDRDASPRLHAHSALGKPKCCVPRTKCEPYGARSC